MHVAREDIDRREAVRRALLLVGGPLSAPAVVAALARAEAAQRGGASWAPRVLTAEQLKQVTAIAEHIIPATDTPGAREAGVPQFVDTMLAEYYTKEERDRFLGGLTELDARARREYGRVFLAGTAAQQRELLEKVDREALSA